MKLSKVCKVFRLIEHLKQYIKYFIQTVEVVYEMFHEHRTSSYISYLC